MKGFIIFDSLMSRSSYLTLKSTYLLFVAFEISTASICSGLHATLDLFHGTSVVDRLSGNVVDALNLKVL